MKDDLYGKTACMYKFRSEARMRSRIRKKRSAILISSKMDKQFLTNQGFVIDIHMDNGTIFTASFSEAEKVIFENKWEGTE